MLADWTGADDRLGAPQTPMVNDAMAIQAIYGTWATTRLDNTVYGFGSTVAGSLAQMYDFARNLNRSSRSSIRGASTRSTSAVGAPSAASTCDRAPIRQRTA